MSDDREHLLPAILDDVDVSMALAEDGSVQPWDRLSDETSRAYAAFCAYRDLGPTRSIHKAAQGLGMADSTLRALSAENGWVRRAESYDDHVERAERRLIERGRVQARARTINIAQQLQDKAIAGLAALNPYTLSPKDLIFMADVGVKLERQARGEVDTKRVEFTGQGGGPIEVAQQLSTEDRRELLKRVESQIQERMAQLPKAKEPTVIQGELSHE